jgi:hypothetical protein
MHKVRYMHDDVFVLVLVSKTHKVNYTVIALFNITKGAGNTYWT